MRNVFFLVTLCISHSLFSQDDIPDYRPKRDRFVSLQDKDIRADLATFTMAGIDESISKLPLNKIPLVELQKDYAIYKGNDVTVTVKTGIFDPSAHKLLYYDEKWLVKIDNKGFFGNYGKIPRVNIKSVTVRIGQDSVNIPHEAFFDLYNPSFMYKDAGGTQRSLNGVYLSNDKRKIYIYMLSMDDRGSYEVTWVIQDKQYIRRVVDFGFMTQ